MDNPPPDPEDPSSPAPSERATQETIGVSTDADDTQTAFQVNVPEEIRTEPLQEYNIQTIVELSTQGGYNDAVRYFANHNDVLALKYRNVAFCSSAGIIHVRHFIAPGDNIPTSGTLNIMRTSPENIRILAQSRITFNGVELYGIKFELRNTREMGDQEIIIETVKPNKDQDISENAEA